MFKLNKTNGHKEKERILIEYGVSTLGKDKVKTSSGKDLVLFDSNKLDDDGELIVKIRSYEDE